MQYYFHEYAYTSYCFTLQPFFFFKTHCFILQNTWLHCAFFIVLLQTFFSTVRLRRPTILLFFFFSTVLRRPTINHPRISFFILKDLRNFNPLLILLQKPTKPTKLGLSLVLLQGINFSIFI